MPKEPRATERLRPKTYTCSCIKFCKGIVREISKATYLRHSKHAAKTQSATSSVAPAVSSGPQSFENNPVRSLLCYQFRTNTQIIILLNLKDLQLDSSTENGLLPEQGSDTSQNLAAELPYDLEDDSVESLDVEDPGCLNEIRTEASLAENTGSSDFGACLDELFENTHLAELRMANDFIRELQNATLESRWEALRP